MKCRSRFSLSIAAALAAAVTLGVGGAEASSLDTGSVTFPWGSVAPMSDIEKVLSNPAQDRMEAAARLMVLAPEVQAAKHRMIEELGSWEHVTDDATRQEIVRYVDGMATVQAMRVWQEQREPTAIFRMPFPIGRAGLENPDNIYRSMMVDSRYSYVITGKKTNSFGLYFQLVSGDQGDGSLFETLGSLSEEDLKTDPDGNFRITLNGAPDGAPGENHIQLKPGSKIIYVRDTMPEWSSMVPASLSLERIGGDPVVPLANPAAEVARRIVSNTTFWMGYVDRLSAIPANTMRSPAPAAVGLPGQVNVFGRFDLDPDQAMIVTVDAADAPYFVIQVANNLFTSINYWDHTSSLNNTQAQANPDGSITFVIADKDPGVANWLDPAGVETGLIFARWQGLANGVVPPAPTVRIVPTAQVTEVLPAGTPTMTPDERRAQLRERRADFDRRGIVPVS